MNECSFWWLFLKPSLSTQMDKLKVSLPKFSIRGSLELNEPLASLNISKLFGAGGPGDDHHDDEEGDDDHGHEFHLSCLTIIFIQAQTLLDSLIWRPPQSTRCNKQHMIAIDVVLTY